MDETQNLFIPQSITTKKGIFKKHRQGTSQMQQAKKPACFRQEPAGALVPHFIHLGPRELFPCLM